DRRDLRLAGDEARANILLRCQNLTVSAPDGRKLLALDRLNLARGDRIAILGGNASGKSTLLRKLVEEAGARREQLAATAQIYFSPQARPVYFDRELSRWPSDRALFDFFQRSFDLGNQAMHRE